MSAGCSVALLPLLWAALLAQHLGLGMAAAGAWCADPHVIGFCQSLMLLVGVGGSVQRRLSTDIENCTAASDDSKVVHLQSVPHADSIAPGSKPQRGLRWL